MKRVWGILFFLLVIGSVNAAIFIEDNFENKYNVGERVLLDFKVSSDSSVSDFLESYLRCDGDRVLVDKRYVFLDAESRNFDIEFPLREEGECQFEINFRNDKAVSEEFEISSEIEMKYFLNDKYFFPEEKISVSGNLTKFNGDYFSGVIDFKLGAFVDKSYNAKNGTFSFDYELSKNIVPGEYKFELEVSEYDSSGDLLNYGKVVDSVHVKSKPTFVEIVSPESVMPGTNESFNVRVLDQARNLMENESVVVKFVDSNSSVVFRREVESNDNISYSFPSDFIRGTSYINAYYGSIGDSLPVYVLENKEVSVGVKSNSIEFSNVGNVFYDGTVSYTLEKGNETIENFVNVSLDVGESYLEKLEYNGEYNITSGDSFFGNVPITGAAVLVDDEGDFRWFSLFIVFLFFVLLFFGYCFVRKRLGHKCFFSRKAENDYDKYVKSQKKSEDNVNKESVKKMIVSANSNKEESPKVKVFMVFLKVNSKISDYESLFNNYGFKLNIVDSGMGYSLFYQGEEKTPELKVFNFGRAIKRFADSRGDSVSVVLNRGVFEKKVSILKKFALFNRELLNNFPAKFVVSSKIMDEINIRIGKVEKVVEIMGRKIRVFLID